MDPLTLAIVCALVVVVAGVIALVVLFRMEDPKPEVRIYPERMFSRQPARLIKRTGQPK